MSLFRTSLPETILKTRIYAGREVRASITFILDKTSLRNMNVTYLAGAGGYNLVQKLISVEIPRKGICMLTETYYAVPRRFFENTIISIRCFRGWII